MPSVYQYRDIVVGGVHRSGEFHDAIDIWAKKDAPVYAAADGTVFLVADSGNSGFGKHVYIKHGNGYYTRYAHLNSYNVKQGQTVKRGQQIGKVGNTGGVARAKDGGANDRIHLDFAICDSSFCGCTNPMYYFGNELKAWANHYYTESSKYINGKVCLGSNPNNVWVKQPISGSYNFDKYFNSKSNTKAKVTIKFDGNGATSNTFKTQTYTVGTKNQTFSGNISRTGYTMLGWSQSKTATTATYSKNSAVTDNWINSYNGKTVTLYAVWKKNATTKTVAVTKVSLDKTSLTLEVGNTSKLTATVAPLNASNKSVTWKSSNTSVATVSGGTVKGIKAGTATITVTTNDGKKTSTCKVTVKAPTYKTGLYNVNGTWKYYENGKFKSATGLAQRPDNGKWYYVKNGIFNKYTGWVKKVFGNQNTKYWVSNGEYTGSSYTS